MDSDRSIVTKHVSPFFGYDLKPWKYLKLLISRSRCFRSSCSLDCSAAFCTSSSGCPGEQAFPRRKTVRGGAALTAVVFPKTKNIPHVITNSGMLGSCSAVSRDRRAPRTRYLSEGFLARRILYDRTDSTCCATSSPLPRRQHAPPRLRRLVSMLAHLSVWASTGSRAGRAPLR